MSEFVDPSELLNPSNIEKLARNPVYTTGHGFEEVEYEGKKLSIHCTNNLRRTFATFLRLNPNGDELPEAAGPSSLLEEVNTTLLGDYGLAEAFARVRLNHPQLFELAKTLVEEEEELIRNRFAARDSGNPDDIIDSYDAWQLWQNKNVRTNKRAIVMSALFDAAAPYVRELGLTRVETRYDPQTGRDIEVEEVPIIPADLCR